MKKLLPVFVLVLAVMLTGCAWFKHQDKPAAVAAKPASVAPVAPKMIVTADVAATAKVVSVNTVGRFVVLSFSGGGMPGPQQTFFLYRAGLKVAEVRITGPQQEDNIVADLVSGDAKVGDTVSAQ
jgi:hypothetical protein